MSLAAVRARVLESADVIQDLAAQVILDLHVRQRRGHVEDLSVGQLADGGRGMDVVARHEPVAGVLADAEEGS